MDKIILEGMEFFGYHGVLPEERSLGQRFIVDLDLELDLKPAGVADDVSRTVDYAAVFELVEKSVTERSYFLIEALAEDIANRVLVQFPVEAVVVRVKKPQAPIAGHFASMAVEIRRSRVQNV